MRRALVALLTFVYATVISGCGTLISGTHQKVELAMSPPGTELEVFHWSGESLAGPGASPGKLRVHRPVRSESYLVRAAKAGYCPRYWVTSSRPSGGAWTYLWMAFWPALGPLVIVLTAALVDGATGGCCAMSPDEYDATLAPEAACLQ